MSVPLKRISQPRGLLRLLVLYRLSKESMSGYGLIANLDSITGGAWHPGSSSVYPLLDDLRRKGLITVASKGPRSRQIYALTAKGRKTFEEHKRMMNEFARKWNRVRAAMIDLVSAENLCGFVLEATKLNGVAWDRILKSEELTESQIELTLKEYKLILDRELRWTNEKLKSLA